MDQEGKQIRKQEIDKQVSYEQWGGTCRGAKVGYRKWVMKTDMREGVENDSRCKGEPVERCRKEVMTSGKG